MLTRLQVSGFKNLVDVDVRFGPFTCVAGANGVGKSNLFDAIAFLSALARFPLMEAASTIRDGRTADVANLFHRVGDDRDPTTSFTVEMIIPKTAEDDLGRTTAASTTFLRYSIDLTLRRSEGSAFPGGIEIRKESLERINITQAGKNLLFPYSKEWRDSALQGRRSVPFISTLEDGTIQLHQDQGGKGGGKPSPFRASSLPRTVLSTVNAAEHRTAVVARREMQSWRCLQLDPAALREPDSFTAPGALGNNGSHLAATLFHLAQGGSRPSENPDPERTYARVANRLAELIDDVREVGVDADPKRELWTLFASGKDRVKHPARALSDGTLRFLALAVMELDPAAQGVLCLEEPENGIHPERIPAMLRLLKDIAVDTELPVGPDNPLRQVIINTHSPSVVGEVDDASLLFAQLREKVRDRRRFQIVQFAALSDTWRTNGTDPASEVAKGDVLAYLSGPRPAADRDSESETPPSSNGRSTPAKTPQKPRRVIDRDDLQGLLNFQFGDETE